MGRKKKLPPLVNIFQISHFVFLAGLETTCYWPGWISLRGLSKWNLNTGTIVCVRVCIFFFFMERNELMAFPNCRFENFWPLGICCLFLPRWEKESRDKICCVTAAVVSNINTPWNHHLSLCNLTVRRRKVEEKTAAVHEQDGCVFEEGDAVMPRCIVTDDGVGWRISILMLQPHYKQQE